MANENNKTDYSLPRTNLFELLPEVYKSEANETVFENTINRFLTKPELEKVAGFLGQGNPKAIRSRQIPEPTPHRQAFQLQPLLFSKIGTIEHISSWKDIQNELTRLGVDMDRFKEWGNAQKFNWVPPIDLDKLIRFQNYFWVDEDNSSSRPQYITVRNRCTTAQAKLNFWNGLIDTFGATIAITDVDPATSTIEVAGDQTLLFQEDFVFFIKNSTNVDLDSSFQQVVSSTFDETTQTTDIVIASTFTDSTADGVISLEEEQAAREAEVACRCSGTTGYDIEPWDDNQIGDVLWADGLLTDISHPDQASWEAVNGPPATSTLKIWYDTSTDELKEFDGVSFVVVIQNFSLIVVQLTGKAFWDFTEDESCFETGYESLQQWQDENKWIHRDEVQNFAKARRAQLPIIEYDWNLEPNEWTFTDYNWKYRPSGFEAFQDTDDEPNVMELTPIEFWEYDAVNDELVFDDRYGDLTDFLVPGTKIQTTTTTDVVEVERSRFFVATDGQPYQTRVAIVEDIGTTTLSPGSLAGSGTASTTPLRPQETSQGDAFRGYGDHWLFLGAEPTLPVNHQPDNPFDNLDPEDPFTADVSGDFDYKITYNAMLFAVKTDGLTDFVLRDDVLAGTTRSLRRRALIGNQDVRVYVDGIREFGTFDELSEADLALGADTEFVAGIRFVAGTEPPNPSNVRIEVGPASSREFGLAVLPVRVDESNADFISNGTTQVSLLKYRRNEQVKTETNQYPLFDIYTCQGETAHRANPIFGFKTSPDAPVDPNVGLRLVVDDLNWSFDQFILDADDAPLFAWRTLQNQDTDFWFNPLTEELRFWDPVAQTWSDKTDMSGHFREGIVSDVEPGSPERDIDGFFWYDTFDGVLFERDIGTFQWVEETDVAVNTSDPTLQTIWRAGLNDEEYVPEYVDENRDPITIGDPDGDWEIPDQLFFNHLHENRKCITSQELLTHFNTIIDAQPRIPAFPGPKNAAFHLIPTDEVNFGLGGKIMEFNDGFDSLLSSTFVNSITPPTLIEFAHDRYAGLQNTTQETYRTNLVDLMTDTSQDALIDIESLIIDQNIFLHETNDNVERVFGDSTTFTDVPGTDDELGIRNWIATLPYVKLLEACEPIRLVDEDRDVNEIVHHDGHRDSFSLTPATVEGLIRVLVGTPDNRTGSADTFGRQSAGFPPNNITEFASAFSTDITNRMGVYWHDTSVSPRVLYRLNLVAAQINTPSSSFPDGSLWMDLTPGSEVLRVKNGATWDVVDGLTVGDGRLHNGTTPSDLTTATVSAWQVFDINSVLTNLILEIENRLFENVPDPLTLNFDLDSLRDTPEKLVRFNSLLEEQFLAFTSQAGIVAPFSSVGHFDLLDPFTYNYKFSTSGARFNIVDSDASSDTFTIEGDQTAVFIAGFSFFVKNAGLNSGTHETASSVFDAFENETTITVTTDVVADSTEGILYTGILPSSANDGSESGGDYRDFYLKLFGTPWPHLEPWKLQGFKNKPDWWDSRYSNEGNFADSLSFGDRRWKYRHGFIVTDADDTADEFTILGDFTSTFTAGFIFEINGSPANDGFWTVDSSSYDSGANETTITVVENVTSALAGGRILVGVGMWENIRAGIIPAGEVYSNGVTSITGNPIIDQTVHGLRAPDIPTYNYFCVMIDNQAQTSDGSTFFDPDDLLPPFWNYRTVYGSVPLTFDQPIRSLFFDFGSQVQTPGADYRFGDRGPVEYEWFVSAQRLYDEFKVAYQIQPQRFIHQAFNDKSEFINVGDLQIDGRLGNECNTFGHNRTTFHGEVVGDEIFRAESINQWYVNFNRFFDFDFSWADFRRLWIDWTAPLMYQFSSFVDTTSLEIAHRFFDFTSFDHRITKKRSPAVDVDFLDSFDIVLLSIPPRIIAHRNEQDWVLEVRTSSPLGRPVDHFPVHNYPFVVTDQATGTMKAYTYNIQALDPFNETFTVNGDQTEVFEAETQLEVTDSTGNDGIYNVIASVYNPVDDTTIIEVADSISSSVADGLITALIRIPPFETGTTVFLTTHGFLPAPLQTETAYFFIKVSDREFRLARTPDDAELGNAIVLSSNGRDEHFVGQIKTTFRATAGQQRTDDIWYHYTIDDRETRQLAPPKTIRGIQTLINIIDGYEAKRQDDGFVFNADSTLRDEETGRLVNWQLELERFINFAHGARIRRDRIPNRFAAEVDDATNVWTFTAETPNFITGDAVNVLSSSVFPTPIVRGLRYYIIRDSLTDFRLAASPRDAEAGNEIDIEPTVGVGDLEIISAANRTATLPRFEINPFRKAIWFEPQQGIVSNIITGPTEDIRETNLIFDQFGRALGIDNLRIFRFDKITKIEVSDGIPNDIEPMALFPDIRNFLHIAGTQLFTDTFEHVLVFNNYTTEDALVYDPFLGLNATKFEVLFERSPNFTGRPNVGGHYLSTFFNQGADLKRNIEAQIEDMRLYYDTYQIPENIETTMRSRATLGYKDGVVPYLDDINVNAKSQFAFWRGLIQHKGSLNAVKAFVNSRRFIGADIDEFWARKIAEYGSPGEKEYPEMFLTTRDARSNELRLEFPRLPCLPGFENQAYEQEDCGYAFPDDGSSEPIARTDPTFTGVLTDDITRWFDQPDVQQQLIDNGGSLYFDTVVRNRLDVELPNPTGVLIRHNFGDDHVEITMRVHPEGTVDVPVETVNWSPGDTSVTLNFDYIPLTDSLTVFKNGIKLDNITDWNETISGSLFSDTIEFQDPLVTGDVLEVVFGTSTLVPDEHYEIVNSNIVRILEADLVDDAIVQSPLTIWGFIEHKDALNPSKIIDKEAGVVIDNVEIWDPARGHHYSQAINIPTLINEEDQAIYTDSLLDQTIGAAPPVLVEPWNQAEVGTIWMDTSKLLIADPSRGIQDGYVPYYDVDVFGVEDRIRFWGQLADWADIRIFEWVESDVPPSEWDALAAVEQNDKSIPEATRKSGTAKRDIFRRDRDNFEFTATAPTIASVSVPLISPDNISLTDPTGLINDSVQTFQASAGQTLFTLVNTYIPGAGMLSVTRNGSPVAFTETSSTSFTLTVAASVDDTVVATITSPEYETRITIDGTVFDVVIRGAEAQNYGELLDQLRNDVPTATFALTNNNIVITSPTIGAASSVDVDDTVAPAGLELFQSLADIDAIGFTGTDSDTGADGFLTFVSGGFVDGDLVRVSSTDTLPTPLEQGVEYEVTGVAGSDFQLVGQVIQDVGSGTHTIAESTFDDDAWVLEETVFEEFDVLLDGISTGPGTFDFTTTVFDIGDTINIYVNGLLHTENFTVTSPVIEVDELEDVDRVRFVRFGKTELTDEEATFDPDEEDDGTIHTQFMESFNFTAVDVIAPNGVDVEQRFYFWVENTTTRRGRLLSPSEAVTQLVDIPVPFMFFQKIKRAQRVTVEGAGVVVDLPVRYVQTVIKGLRGLIDADRRFVLRFTRDFTLRDDLDKGTSDLQLKNLHAEWEMFREQQLSVIPRNLWDKITEAIVGFKLDDPNERVPSLNRQLYDVVFEDESANTQYGLREGQAFVDGPTALETVLADLTNPDNFDKFKPIDINTFFAQNDFTSSGGIIEAMDEIYTTFPFENTNRIFFEVLHDAFAFDLQNPDIFKTSWIALIGIQPFEIEGAFDD